MTVDKTLEIDKIDLGYITLISELDSTGIFKIFLTFLLYHLKLIDKSTLILLDTICLPSRSQGVKGVMQRGEGGCLRPPC